MAQAAANFYLDDRFYKAGDKLPKEVASRVGKHLLGGETPTPPAEEPQEAPQAPVAPSPEDVSGVDDAEASQGPSRAELEALTARELVELAKEAGITGKHNKAELITKLLGE